MTFSPQRLSSLVLLLCWFLWAQPVVAQDSLTGAFDGYVTINNPTAPKNKPGTPIKDVEVEIRNRQTGIATFVRTDAAGHFQVGQLAPAYYSIRISVPGYQPIEIIQELRTKYRYRVQPNPVLNPSSSTT